SPDKLSRRRPFACPSLGLRARALEQGSARPIGFRTLADLSAEMKRETLPVTARSVAPNAPADSLRVRREILAAVKDRYSPGLHDGCEIRSGEQPPSWEDGNATARQAAVQAPSGDARDCRFRLLVGAAPSAQFTARSGCNQHTRGSGWDCRDQRACGR